MNTLRPDNDIHGDILPDANSFSKRNNSGNVHKSSLKRERCCFGEQAIASHVIFFFSSRKHSRRN